MAVPIGIYQPFFRRAKKLPPIEVTAFEMQASYVTREQFLDFVRSYPQWRKSQARALFVESTYLQDWRGDLDPGEDLARPVTFVSWFAAKAYCGSVGGQLPSVAQWERVAGAPQKASARRVSDAPERSPLHFAMGTVAPELQHTDLHVGELWEWNADFNSSVISGRNAAAQDTKSLFCGDGYRATNPDDYGAFLRYSFRSSLRGNYTLKSLGFRCVTIAS